VLQWVALTLTDHVRAQGNVIRLGGDAFAVLLPGADVEEGRVVAERLRTSIYQGLGPKGPNGPYRMTMSWGVAGTSAATHSAEELYEATDRALYLAKSQGRDRVTVEFEF